MQRSVPSLFFSTLVLAFLGCLIPLTVKAQVTPDGTTSTTVNREGDNFTVEQGDRVGDNLFHSFDEFSVPTGGSAGFDNAADIANIFSRVTGSSISNIDGLLGANGAANLFLINPNGIIFGENARLNLGGSFFASTADSLLFEGDAEFSAVNPQAPPLLEVSIPIGARFRDNPGDIVNRSFVQNNTGEFVGLEVLLGKNLTLLGGNIDFEAGEAKASGGNINIGSSSSEGIVNINQDSTLEFSERMTRANINLSNGADVDVRGMGRGNININAANLNLTTGNFGFAQLRAGILSNSTIADAKAGDINVNLTENFVLDEGRIFNFVEPGAIGSGGGFNINAANIIVNNGGQMSVSSLGEGNAGEIAINAAESVILDGTSIDSNLRSAIFNTSEATMMSGNAGDININTPNLTLTNGGGIFALTLGEGNAGDITINATESINISNTNSTGNLSSAIANRVESNATGNGGNIKIDTPNLSLIGGGQISANTAGEGNSGMIAIDASDSLIIDSSSGTSNLSSAIRNRVELNGTGNANNLSIATSNLQLINEGQIDASTFGDGNSGSIDIQVNSLSLTEESLINANTLGKGNGGQINIQASDLVFLDASAIASVVEENAQGNSGEIKISTDNLTLSNGSLIDNSILGSGNASEININAKGNVSIEGINSLIFSQIGNNAQGNSTGIKITATDLSLIDGGSINANSLGIGTSGDIDIQAKTLLLQSGGQIISQTFNQGNGGKISLNIENSIEIFGLNETTDNFSEISTETFGEGNAGNIELSAGSLTLKNTGIINSSTSGIGNGGNISLNLENFISLSNESVIASNSFGFGGSITNRFELGDSGNINIQGESLSLNNGSRISSGVTGLVFATPGNISIDVDNGISLTGENRTGTPSSISSNTNGLEDAGNIDIRADSLFLGNGANIEVNNDLTGFSNGGSIFIGVDESIVLNGISQNGSPSQIVANAVGSNSGGNIEIQASSLFLNNGAGLSSIIERGVVSEPANGSGGNVTLEISEILSFSNNGSISAQANDNAIGGNITINANDGFILAFPNQNNDIIANASEGRGGNINIDTQVIFGLEERPLNSVTNDINASSEATGLDGTVDINNPTVDPTTGLINLPASVGDASDQISQNPCQQGVGSEFIVTGKGGLPPNPTESLNSDRVKVGLVEPVVSQRQSEGEVQRETTNSQVSEAVPAMGWVFNDKGEVTLTAYSTDDTKNERSLRVVSSNCSAF